MSARALEALFCSHMIELSLGRVQDKALGAKSRLSGGEYKLTKSLSSLPAVTRDSPGIKLLTYKTLGCCFPLCLQRGKTYNKEFEELNYKYS